MFSAHLGVMFVPAYQKDEWANHAEKLDMSQSEFVRTMVQVGRRDFTVAEEPAGDPSNPRGNGLDDRILEVLDGEGPLSFDALVESLTADLEERLKEAIESLQDANEIHHTPRKGYALSEGSK